ncbi:MAG: VOC family protein [Chloroflexi bacterium]|nr:VOC family protein [Chloroflexota bacterium]
MIRTLGLTHLALAVRDLDRTLRFYQQAFGTRVLHREEGRAEVNTPGANDIITFVEGDSPDPGQTGGIAHFGFRLVSPDDIAAAVAEVERAGGTVEEGGEFVPGEPYVFFRDPDGYLIEVWFEKEGA